MIERCDECGSVWKLTVCLKSKKRLCSSCCDVDCPDHFACWGRYM